MGNFNNFIYKIGSLINEFEVIPRKFAVGAQKALITIKILYISCGAS